MTPGLGNAKNDSQSLKCKKNAKKCKENACKKMQKHDSRAGKVAFLEFPGRPRFPALSRPTRAISPRPRPAQACTPSWENEFPRASSPALSFFTAGWPSKSFCTYSQMRGLRLMLLYIFVSAGPRATAAAKSPLQCFSFSQPSFELIAYVWSLAARVRNKIIHATHGNGGGGGARARAQKESEALVELV